MKELIVDVVIPAYNEQDSIGKVLTDIPRKVVREVVVVDNNSTDNTAEMAKKAGAVVLFEAQPGYGRACLKGISYLARKSETPDILVFMDGDYSDYPEELVEVTDTKSSTQRNTKNRYVSIFHINESFLIFLP